MRNNHAFHFMRSALDRASKVVGMAAVVLVLALIGNGCSHVPQSSSDAPVAVPPQSTTIPRLSEKNMPLVVAHRSCWREAPENSLRAMNACIDIGVDMLEIDIRRTKDGHLVVIHDATVDRTTDGSGVVAEMTLGEIKGLKLKEGAGGADAPITGYSVPTLEEVLLALKGRILINLDAKEAIREATVVLVQSIGVQNQVVIKAVVSSPQASFLTNAMYLESVTFMPIIRPENGNPSRQVATFVGEGVEAFEIIYETERQLQEACIEARELNARCWVNTMWESLSPGHSDDLAVKNPEEHWGRLIDLGVDMFQTDRPRELIAYLSNRIDNVAKR